MRLLVGFSRSTALLLLAGAIGCKSAMVDATIHNRSPRELQLLELRYPSASFGTGTLAAGADFHYRFKILGNGPLSLTYTAVGAQERTAKGPELNEGQHGPLGITVTADGVVWNTAALTR